MITPPRDDDVRELLALNAAYLASDQNSDVARQSSTALKLAIKLRRRRMRLDRRRLPIGYRRTEHTLIGETRVAISMVHGAANTRERYEPRRNSASSGTRPAGSDLSS